MEILPDTRMDRMLYSIFIECKDEQILIQTGSRFTPMIFYFELLFDAENVPVLEASVMMALKKRRSAGDRRLALRQSICHRIRKMS